MYWMYFLFYSHGAAQDSAEPGASGSCFGQDDAPVRSIQTATALDRFTTVIYVQNVFPCLQ